MKSEPINTTSGSHRRGALLVGHGTRNPLGLEEFHVTARQVARRLAHWEVHPCFLEFGHPSIQEAIAQLAERGVRQIVAIPLLLFAAGHAKRDIPEALALAVDELEAQYGRLDIHQTGHLGCHDQLLELSALRFREAVEANESGRHRTPHQTTTETTTARDSLLLVVGRGSRDVTATQEMLQFVQLRAQGAPVAGARACFLAMAEPSLDTVLSQITKEPWKRVVVQPHLLFHGRLLDAIQNRVEEVAAREPTRQWVVTRHLGPHSRLVDAVVGQAEDCVDRIAVAD